MHANSDVQLWNQFLVVNSDSTHQKWMKFTFIVTGSIFLQSQWVLDRVWPFEILKLKTTKYFNLEIVAKSVSKQEKKCLFRRQQHNRVKSFMISHILFHNDFRFFFSIFNLCMYPCLEVYKNLVKSQLWKFITLFFYNYEHPKKGQLPILLSRLARDS